jgi:cytochrome c biogenesis protein CcmG, thiol:disulfide interchange protein DsbE
MCHPWPVARKLLVSLGALALVAVVVVGLIQASDNGDDPAPPTTTGASASAKLEEVPGPLGALYRRPDALVPGGSQTLDAEVARLKGTPVVVNAWASWCGPCRAEFPFFQRQAAAQGARVGFLGLNVADNTGDAKAFQRKFPVPYPSVLDPDERVSQRFKVTGLPYTIFYDRRGKVSFVHQGGYPSENQLAQDIQRYALGT